MLMSIGAVGMSVILLVLSGLRGRSEEWKARPVLAKGLYGVSELNSGQYNVII